MAKAPRSNRGGAVGIPSITLTQILKRHTVAPRGSRVHYENVRQGATKAPRSDPGGAVSMSGHDSIREIMTGAVNRARYRRSVALIVYRPVRLPICVTEVDLRIFPRG